jgi:hypothetical protein
MTKDTGRNNIIALWACFAIVYGLTFAFPAHAEQIAGQPFPVFTIDGTASTTNTFDSSRSYYGGITFIPETTFTANAFKISACSNAPTGLPVQVFYRIYEITGLTATSASYSSYSHITSVAGLIESCSGGLQDTFINHAYDFDPTQYTFTVGHKFMILPAQPSYIADWLTVWQYISFKTTATPATSVIQCFEDIFCDTNVFYTANHSAVWITFADTGTAVVLPVTTCLMSTFPFIDIFSCIKDTLVYVFIPQSTAFDSFITLKDDIKNKAPFGYFTSAVSSMSDISSTSTPAFTLATSSPIMTYIFNPLRTGLAWVLYLAGLIWLYKRLTNIDI